MELRCFSIIIKNRLLIAWILVLGSLSGLSVYNAYWVTYDYLYNNKATEVIVQPLENILPLVKSVSVYYEFVEKAVFPETWGMDDTELDQLLPNRPPARPVPDGGWPAIRRLTTRINKTSFRVNDSTGRLTLESLIDVAAITNLIYKMDDQFIKCGEKLSENWASNYNVAKLKNDPELCGNYTGELTPAQEPFPIDDTIRPQITPVLDAFLQEGYGVKFTEMALGAIIDSDYWGGVNFTDVPIDIKLDTLEPFGLQLSIPFDFIANLSPTDPRPVFGLLPFGVGNASQFPDLNTFRLWLGDWIARGTTGSRNVLSVVWAQGKFGKPAEPKQWAVSFDNAGVFDSSDLRNEDKCAVCGNSRTVDECRFKCRIDALVDDCGCVPFTYRRLYSDDAERRSKPFCTSQLYKACYELGKYKRSKCSGSDYVPCVVIENKYSSVAMLETMDVTPYKLNLGLLWDKSSYTIFQDKEQNNWMQMLGQLGGNLGIFLSFSLIGLWKFVIFLAVYYKKWRTGKRSKSSLDEAPAFIASWIRFTQLNAEASATKHIMQKEVEGQIEGIRKNNEKISAQLDTANQQIDALRSRMENMDENYKLMKAEYKKLVEVIVDPRSSKYDKQGEREKLGLCSENDNGVPPISCGEQ